ncbi:MAG: DUF2339 domain-containing protein [Endomicrobium sp.]|nr:DUF2339 domain-containing protein [Endomicrobium sp.]
MLSIKLLIVLLFVYVLYLTSRISDIEKKIKELKNKKTDFKEQTANKQILPEKPRAAAPVAVVDLQKENSVNAEQKQPEKIQTEKISDLPKKETPKTEHISISETSRHEEPEKSAINWEIFTGVKLFAWVGGFAAFLGIVFFTKYAIDNMFISPAMRVNAGFLAGIALICAGVLTKSEKLKTTGNALSAIGIVFIYVCAFAAGNIYHMFGFISTFIIMVTASAAAFAIAVGKNAKYIAVLAGIGGYLTPVLLSTGSGMIVPLAVYMAVITVTIMVIAVKKDWGFLVCLAAAGVYIILYKLRLERINGFMFDRVHEATAVYAAFCALFTAFAAFCIKKCSFKSAFYRIVPFIYNLLSFIFVFSLFSQTAYLPLALLCIINLCLFVIKINDNKYFGNWYAFASSVSFTVLLFWTIIKLNQNSLYIALAACFVFFLLNSVLPFFNAYKKKIKFSQSYGIFAALLLFVLAVCTIKVHFVYLIFWAVAMIAAFSALAYAEMINDKFTGFLGVFAIFTTIFAWLVSTRFSSFDEISFAGITVGFALGVFTLAAVLKKKGAQAAKFLGIEFIHEPSQPLYCAYNVFFISTFVLFLAAIIKSKPAVADVFIVSGLAVTLFIIFLSVINESKNFIGFMFAAVSMFIMQFFWQTFYYTPEVHKIVCLLYFIVFIFFFSVVFLLKKQIINRKMPWAVSSFMGILQCFLIYLVSKQNPALVSYLGAIPAIFAVIYGFAVLYILRLGKMEDKFQKSRVGFFASSLLFFVTLIFPMQFKTQWLILGWAMEAAALIWLFKIIHYKPLKYWGFWIFAAIFAYLFVPQVSLFEVTSGSLLNRYLYTYSIVIVSIFSGALLWTADKQNNEINIRKVLFTMSAILLFTLLNIEIAAFFATGKHIHFSLSNSFAQDMSYTLCWGLFAIGMFVLGIIKKVKAARISGLALLSVATFKLFMHDLWSLGQLYRIGSLFGLAAMLIIVSFLYQKYIGRVEDK